MPIVKGDVKMMASQLLTDDDDAGGMMSGIEIVDGNVNNMYPDISRFDRVYGRVSLRKSFVSVQTNDNSTYYGAHLVLSDPPDDPRVAVSMFAAYSASELRESARNRLEAYVVKGATFSGYLTGNQLEGARALQIIQRESFPLPRVGDVLYIEEGDENQYVRVTDVTSEIRGFSYNNNGTLLEFTRRLATVEIGDTLRVTFHGSDPNPFDTAGAAKLYATHVADAMKYYGVSRLESPITAGDLTFRIDSIFNPLVPSAQAESPVVDISAAGACTGTKQSGSARNLTTSLTLEVGTKIFCGTGITRGSLSITCGGSTWTDDGTGQIRRAGTAEGTVEYGTGEILFQISGVSGVFHVAYTPAVATSGVNRTHGIDVTLASRAYNYTATLYPIPEAGSLVVDYMSQGNWYRLRDNGNGELLPLVSGTGSGTLNLETGSVIVTCGALPDVESTILFLWSAPVEYSEAVSTVVNDAFATSFQLANSPIEAGSLSFSQGGGDTITDDGEGNLVGADGTVDYQTGTVSMIQPTIQTVVFEPVVAAYYSAPAISAVSGSISQQAGPQNTSTSVGAINADTFKINGLVYTHGDMPLFSGTGSKGGLAAYEKNGKLMVSTSGIVLASHSGARGEFSAVFTSSEIEVGSCSPSTGAVTLYGSFTADVTTRGTQPQVFHNPLDPFNPRVTDMPFSVHKTVSFTANSGSRSWSAYETSRPYEPQGETITPPTGGGTNTTLTTTGTISEAVSGAVTEETPDPGDPPFITGSIIGELVNDAVALNIGSVELIIHNGVIYSAYNPISDTGTIVGSLAADGTLILQSGFVEGPENTIVLKSVVVKTSNQYATTATFRTPGAPVRPGSFYIQARSMGDGELISATADLTGAISATNITGSIKHDTGVVSVKFGRMVSPASDYTLEPWYHEDLVDGDSVWMPVPVDASTITYNCVVYSYIPLDADLIGLDPVRLPQDGRVPVFRPGNVIVLHHTLTDTLPTGLVAGQTVSLSRGNISHVDLYDADGVYVPSTNYTADLAAGTVTMADPLDLSGFTEPLVANHRREDMRLASDVQINGDITVTQTIDNDYPAGTTYVSGALPFGDLQSRVSHTFDQKTWTNVWSDTRIGDAATATYNTLNYPVTTTNSGAITEKWALKFDSAEHFQIMGETVGIIGEGYITTDTQPINPATNQPYFRVLADGWGSGWISGNVLRFNTRGAAAGVWFVRTTLQGPVTEPDDEFVTLIRGDAA